MKIFGEKVIMAVLGIVFVSAFLIYGWNLLHGRNLAHPPKFDWSGYNEASRLWLAEGDGGREGIRNKELGISDEKVGGGQPIAETSRYLYFKNSFKRMTEVQTSGMVSSFLKEFPELKGASIEIINDKDYVCRVKLENNVDKKTLETLQKKYGDMVMIQ